jgi:threonine synthase
VRESGGCVLSVQEAAIEPAGRELASRGLLVEPTAALVWAAALLLRERLEVGVDGVAWPTARSLAAGRVVVPLCGSALTP